MNNYDNYYNGERYTMSTETTNSFVRKVFLNMILGIMVTAFIPAYAFLKDSSVVTFANKHLTFLLISQFILVIVLGMMMEKLSAMNARILFFIYSAMNGLLLSSIGFIFQPISILYTLSVTIIAFTVLAIYGYTTKEDLLKYSTYFKVGLIILIIIALLNTFIFKNPFFYLIETVFGIVIFCGLVAFDMNRIKNIAIYNTDADSELLDKVAIIGALQLYLDFLNLFLYLLRIFGKKRD